MHVFADRVSLDIVDGDFSRSAKYGRVAGRGRGEEKGEFDGPRGGAVFAAVIDYLGDRDRSTGWFFLLLLPARL